MDCIDDIAQLYRLNALRLQAPADSAAYVGPAPGAADRLQRVVNNARLLILPWIQSKGLASKILSKVARHLPKDWQLHCGYRPVLFETFVNSPRHRGTCYKAANWVHVGRTTGRGKKSAVHHQIIPIKDIWLYPLQTDFAAVLCR